MVRPDHEKDLAGILNHRQELRRMARDEEQERKDNGQFGKAGAVAKSINAPDHANIYEKSEHHDGGRITYAKGQTHKEAHKDLTAGGFVKESGKRKTESQKMGKSSAHLSTKEERASYSHPEGHTAEVKTRTSKYGGSGPITHYDIKTKS